MHAKLRSVLSRLGGADAIVMQSIVGEDLAQGPYMYVAARAGGGVTRGVGARGKVYWRRPRKEIF